MERSGGPDESMTLPTSTEGDAQVMEPSVGHGSEGSQEPSPAIPMVPKVLNAGSAESSKEVAAGQPVSTDTHPETDEKGEILSSATQMLSSETKMSTKTSIKPLQIKSNSVPFGTNPTLTPIGLQRGFATGIYEDHAPVSERQVRCREQPIAHVQFDAPPIVAKPAPRHPLPNKPSPNTQFPQSRSQPKKAHKSSPSRHGGNKPWKNDLACPPLKVTVRKRNPSTDVTNPANVENKRPKLEQMCGFDKGKETQRLRKEELQQSARAAIARRTEEERKEEPMAKAHRRERIKAKLESLGPPPSQQALQKDSPATSSRKGSRGRGRPQLALPQNSPLKNVINSASLHEEVVQAKLKVNLAQNQMVIEKAMLGSASGETMARLNGLQQTLATLHRKRGYIRKDAHRMESFRKDDPMQQPGGIQGVAETTGSSPSPWLEDKGWRNRLTLCFEAWEKPGSRFEAPKYVKGDSTPISVKHKPVVSQDASESDGDIRMAETRESSSAAPGRHEPMVKAESINQSLLGTRDEARDSVLTIRQRPQARFALMEVESLL